RMALLPSSGFQSAQFRKIEICSTDFINLLDQKFQNPLSAKADVEEVFPYLYWTQGANDADTGKITITSQHFQEHYQEEFIDLAKEYRDKNLWQQYLKLTPDPLTNDIKAAMRELDTLMNIQWRLGHFKAAARHLKKKNQEEISSTGGTNWQKYLPPRFQKVVFYPRLWEEDELKNWGRNWEDLYDD
ncbi:MAG: tryptophan 2,3-dioxygenase, partial [Bacteroidota bacterium]